MFTNDFVFTRGQGLPKIGQYEDYRFYSQRRHEFKDMSGDENETAAVLLCEQGLFEKTEYFEPQTVVTAAQFMNLVLILDGLAVRMLKTEEVLTLYSLNGWLPEDFTGKDLAAPLTREDMAQLIYCLLPRLENTEQYELLITDFTEISENRRAAVLFCTAAGILEINGSFTPSAPVTKGEAAAVLYRLKYPGSRVTVPFNIGGAYKKDKKIYIVKTRMQKNPDGIMLGTWSRYNHQDLTFRQFGRRPADRVDFYKWRLIEKEKGIYTMPNFANDLKAHRYTNTIITGVDLTANLDWNPRFDKANIPEFYAQTIEDSETRAAAKKFLYGFVKELMTAVRGDIILAIDYEIDWQQMFERNTDDTFRRMPVFADWYAEACSVARKAAADAGAAGRLKLICIYNNMCDVIKLGARYNEWRLKCAAASDYVGIDTYDRYWLDRTDPSLTVSNIRYLINNYSGGKPVMMVENGTPGEDSPDEFSGMNGLERQRQYYFKLFRAFRFELLSGGFIENNLSAYLFWDLIDAPGAPIAYGVFGSDGSKKPAADEIKKGFCSLEKQRQFSPSLYAGSEIYKADIEIMVDGGCDYDRIDIVSRESLGGKKLVIELESPASVLIEQNGEGRYVSDSEQLRHEFNLEPNGIPDMYRLYFGAGQIPFVNRIKKLEIV